MKKTGKIPFFGSIDMEWVNSLNLPQSSIEILIIKGICKVLGSDVATRTSITIQRWAHRNSLQGEKANPELVKKQIFDSTLAKLKSGAYSKEPENFSKLEKIKLKIAKAEVLNGLKKIGQFSGKKKPSSDDSFVIEGESVPFGELIMIHLDKNNDDICKKAADFISKRPSDSADVASLIRDR